MFKKFPWRDGLQCLGVLLATGILDFLTGYDISYFLFYLVPIVFTFRLLGATFAFGMCGLSILTWLLANTTDGQPQAGVISPFWSISMQFLIFVLVVSLLTVRKRLVKQTRQHTEFITRAKSAHRRLEQEVLEASEREQRRIGHDLHDSLCQQLTASALAGKVLANKLKAQSRPEAAAADQLANMMENAIELTRVLSRSLRPVDMKVEGLVDGLRELAASVSAGGKVNCTLECPEIISLETVEANVHLYRIAQEAVNSAIRLGYARNIVIELTAETGWITLTVTDDGNSLASDDWIKDGLGRQIMNYRADMIRATLKVELPPRGGTRVTCSLPAAGAFISETHVEQTQNPVGG
jgi:signal transduction histidine kinase